MMIHNGGIDTEEAESYTVYHKLTTLCSEIESAIKSGSHKSRDDVQAEIMRLRSESFTMTSPEAEYALRLFRCFLEQVGDGSGSSFGDNVNLIEEVPPVLYEGHPDQLSGPEAMKKNIFWMRIVVGGLSFISFVVMACVPNINLRSVGSSDLFDVRLHIRYVLDALVFTPLFQSCFRPISAISPLKAISTTYPTTMSLRRAFSFLSIPCSRYYTTFFR